MSRKLVAFASAATIALSINFTGPANAETVQVPAELLEQLQQLVRDQQQQLNSQQQTIQRLNSRVDQLEDETDEAKSAATEAKTAAIDAQTTATQANTRATQAIGKAEEVEKTAASLEDDAVVTSGSEKVKLSVSGHINRALNYVGDGDETKAYFVDNDVSNSRFRFVGEGKVTENSTLGITYEFGFNANNSGDVSQDNETPDQFFDTRKAEVFFRNDSYGEARFGKGQASADDVAEFDLSLVGGVIAYSGIADIVGGLQFVNDDDENTLSGISVATAFFNHDGERQNRVMYDTPIFFEGLQASVSVGEDQRWDAALKWGHDYADWTGVQFGDFLTLGGVSISDPSEKQDDDTNSVDWRLNGSFSVVHMPTGLGLTVSGGKDNIDNREDPFNTYGKITWDTDFFDIGQTGFGLDYTYTENSSGDDDDGQSVGFALIQLLEDYGLEVYAQGRWFELDRDGSEQDVDDIWAGTFGTRMKF